MGEVRLIDRGAQKKFIDVSYSYALVIYGELEGLLNERENILSRKDGKLQLSDPTLIIRNILYRLARLNDVLKSIRNHKYSDLYHRVQFIVDEGPNPPEELLLGYFRSELELKNFSTEIEGGHSLNELFLALGRQIKGKDIK